MGGLLTKPSVQSNNCRRKLSKKPQTTQRLDRRVNKGRNFAYKLTGCGITGMWNNDELQTITAAYAVRLSRSA